MIFFITNREIININGKEQMRPDGKETAGDNLRYGWYDFAKTEFNLYPEPSSAVDYTKINQQNLAQQSGSARFFGELHAALSSSPAEKGDALFFIHGFNTSVQNLKYNIQQLKERYIDPPHSSIAHLVVFTWPSQSPTLPFHYLDDKQDAIRSGIALARALSSGIKFMKDFLVQAKNPACQKNIHLMVHSMGNRVLKWVMAELLKNNPGIPELFKEIILVAADIEYGIFEEAFDKLIDFGRRVSIYYHEGDRALDISKYTKNFSNRLGSYGRRKSNHIDDVQDINVTSCRDDARFGLSDNLVNHWYYYTSTQVANDIIQILKGGNSNFPTRK